MGVLDRLDDLWDAGFEVGRTSVNTVIDLVEAPFTEDEYEGFVGTIAGVTMDRGAETLVNAFGPEGVGGTLIGALPEPVRDVGVEALDKLEWAYREGVGEPLSAAFTYGSLSPPLGKDSPWYAEWDFFNVDRWKQAYGIAQTRSPGQAIVLRMLTDDILDEKQVAHYEGTAFYNIMSGTWDAAFRFFASPEIFVGRAVMWGVSYSRRAAFNNYFDDGRGFGAFADDVGRMADDAAAPGADAARLEVSVPDDPAMHGVRPRTEGDFGNPEHRAVSEHFQSHNESLRGKATVLSPDDPAIPDTVFHVTASGGAIDAGGVIRAGGGDLGLGAGTGVPERAVSFTASRKVAEQLAADFELRRRIAVAATRGGRDEVGDLLKAESQRWNIKTLSPKRREELTSTTGFPEGRSIDYEWEYYLHTESSKYDLDEVLSFFFRGRNTAGGPRDPLFMVGAAHLKEGRPEPLLSWASKTADDIKIIEVPKANLSASGGAITDFDLGRFLEEIRVYGDVPIGRFADDPELAAALSSRVLSFTKGDPGDPVIRAALEQAPVNTETLYKGATKYDYADQIRDGRVSFDGPTSTSLDRRTAGSFAEEGERTLTGPEYKQWAAGESPYRIDPYNPLDKPVVFEIPPGQTRSLDVTTRVKKARDEELARKGIFPTSIDDTGRGGYVAAAGRGATDIDHYLDFASGSVGQMEHLVAGSFKVVDIVDEGAFLRVRLMADDAGAAGAGAARAPAKAADDTALHDLAGRIREKYFRTHHDGDLVAYELARSYLGRHGFTGGRASMENVMRFFMGETSAIGKIAEDSGEAAGWFGKLFADTAVVDDVLPPGTPGAESARFDRAQAIAADINPDDYLLMDPKKFTGYATIDEVVRPGLRSNLVESMERSSWYRPDGDAGRVGRYAGRTIRVFRDMKPQRAAWVGDANSGEQVARVLQEAGYSAAEVARFRGKWASMTRGQRMSYAQAKQRQVVKRLVNKHLPGLKKAEVDDLLNDFAKSNMSGRSLLSRVVKYDADNEVSTIRIIDPDTGDDVFHHLPLTPGQLEQTVVTLDAKGLDRFLKAAASKHGTDLRNVTGLASDGLKLVMSWWRPAMLLRPAWAIRVVGDEQLRMMAKIGALTQLTDLLGPARREYVDAVLRRKIAGLGGAGELTARQLMTRRAALTGGAGFLFGGPILAGVGAGASLVRNNRNIRRLTARTAAINNARATRGTAAEASGLASMDDLGIGNLDIMGYDVQAAFGDALAPQIVWRKANSANRQAGYLLLDEERKFWDDIGQELGDWNRVWDPRDVGTPVREYARWWERVVNDQYGSNQVGRIAFDDSLGSVDDRVQALVTWVEDPSNADFAAAIQSRLTAEGADGWAAKVVDAADRMLAHPELRAKIASGKRVRFDDLQRVAKEEGTDWRNFVGSVHAQEVFQTGERAITQRGRRLVDRLYERIGTLTTDNLSRNPYFKRVYETDMKRRIARFHQGDGNYELTATQLRALEQSSRRKALQETRDLLYDLAESSQFSDMMRNVMPFFNAWQEVLTRWAGLAVENPVFAARMAQAFRADIQLGDFMQTVETDDGRFFQFRLPERAAGLLKHGIVGNAFDDAGVLRFRASSLNMITQGLPGFGPIAQIPASALVKEKPELEEALRFMLPYGPVDPLQSLQPAWMKRLTSTWAKDRSYESFAAGLMITRMADMENGDLEPIDFDDGHAVAQFIDDVKSDASNFMVLRSVAAAFSPASVQFHSPYQLWIDRYRELRAEDFKTADEKFFAELTAEGNEGFFALAARFTQNNEGLPATIESEQVRKKYLDLIRRHPEVGSLILGIEGGGSAKFSAAVYEKQLMEDTSPGSGVKRRERLSLEEILTNVKAREGWQAYGAMNDVIYNEMRARGLPNLQVGEAKDLRAVRQELIRQLSVEHPLWFDEYRDPDLTKWQDRFDGIRAVVADERLAGRDDIRLLGEYMELRDIFTAELAARKAAGGAQSLTATSNRDLLAVWESMMEEMLENPTFSDLLWRWLEFDPLSRDTWTAAQQEILRLAA